MWDYLALQTSAGFNRALHIESIEPAKEKHSSVLSEMGLDDWSNYLLLTYFAFDIMELSQKVRNLTSVKNSMHISVDTIFAVLEKDVDWEEDVETSDVWLEPRPLAPSIKIFQGPDTEFEGPLGFKALQNFLIEVNTYSSNHRGADVVAAIVPYVPASTLLEYVKHLHGAKVGSTVEVSSSRKMY